jgi:hypothetical protein
MKILRGLVAMGALFSFATVAKAELIAFQSFENYEIAGVQYTDTLDPATDHALLDNAGEPVVNGAPSGTDTVGFSSFYFNTRDGVGLTDGDFVGVTDFDGAVGSYTDGSAGFQISDPDGAMRVTFDAVDISAAPAAIGSMDLFIADTGYESDDAVRVGVLVDGGPEQILFELTGDDLEGIGSWQTLTDIARTGSTLQYFVEMDANSGSEAIYIDNVRLTAVPEPGSFALAGLASISGLGLAYRRRGKAKAKDEAK